MKKVISIVLALTLLLSSLAVSSFAADSALDSVAESFEVLYGTVVSVLAKTFNSVFAKDEASISTAKEQSVSWVKVSKDASFDNPTLNLDAETWVMQEITLISEKTYADPFNDVTLDLVLVGNGRKYTVPGFWDGGNTYKVRFVCPSEGAWYFRTKCSDKTNEDLNGVVGKVNCVAYSGEYDIYKNGFVTTNAQKKYFTYDNGTPFLYLGDTHWSLGDETADMMKTICAKRASQGFTVIQSEPIGATFHVEDGITEEDMAGFASYDEKFQIIADNGLVHANAEFFYPYFMEVLIENFGGYGESLGTVKVNGKKAEFHELSDTAKAYLEKVTRYWVARYGAYPVFWTLGQEVDNDFYWASDNHPEWGYLNNPYQLVAEYIDKYDAFDHPLSAHQENAGATAAYGDGENATDSNKVYRDGASSSAFRDVESHTWYAAQYSPSKTSQSNFEVEKDYWFNSQGKPSVNYEGAYCYLWTKNFGSRMQGWCAYLNGMYGYGWGGHDTWSYLNVYDEDNDSSDGVDTITSQEKKDATWLDSLTYESSYQCGYMMNFLKNIEWYNLVPRFGNKAYFVPASGVYYCYAGNKDNTDIVIYFYSFNDSSVAQKSNTDAHGAVSTGTVGSLEANKEYHYQWFNPITGEYGEEGTFTSSEYGTYFIGAKAATDMVLHIY